MAWNRSSEAPKPAQKKPSAMRGIVAGLVVVVAAAAAYFLLFSGDQAKKPVREDTKKGLIKEVTPAAAPKAVEPKVEKPKKKVEYWEQPTTNGLTDCQILKWKHARWPEPAITNRSILKRQPPVYAVFDTAAENEIASILTMTPGQGMVELPEHDEEFTQQLKEALATPIRIKPDDSEDVKRLKEDMMEVRKDLVQRIADGEDVAKYIRDTRRELVRLGMFREEVEQMRNDLIDQAESEADVDVAFEAANKMLEAKGIAPFEVNAITKKNMWRQVRALRRSQGVN